MATDIGKTTMAVSEKMAPSSELAVVPEETGPEISVLIPVKNEAENLPGLIEEIEAALKGRDFEVVVINDGSTDGTPAVLAGLRDSRPWLRHVRHARSAGQSAAVRTGIYAARGDFVVTMDGDGQNNPAYIPVMVAMLKEGAPKLGIVAGQRQKRTDSGAKRVASRLANKLRGAILNDGTRDSGCGLKALPRDVFVRLPYFDGWHRYLPALVIREGRTVGHLDVVDRQRRHGVSKYGIVDRALVGVLDLFGVWWLRRRAKRIPEVSEVTGDDR
jgi:glycosyltransferase involved in cell wall biosynthesis